MHYAFGTWLARYKGQNRRVHQLKKAFKEKAASQKSAPARFRHVDAVYSLLYFDDCLPDWAEDVLRECEKCWLGGREDFSAREQLSLLTKDLV